MTGGSLGWWLFLVLGAAVLAKIIHASRVRREADLAAARILMDRRAEEKAVEEGKSKAYRLAADRESELRDIPQL